MDALYLKQVQLLLRVLPEIAREPDFALHGGTAINLFYTEMPRLSVDIDLTLIPYRDRKTDLFNIRGKLLRISEQIRNVIPAVQIREPVNVADEFKLYCSLGGYTVKIEVNTVNRGLLEPPMTMPLCNAAQREFASYCEIQTVSRPQLYGGKLVAALDRQHPRDIFDCWQMLRTIGYTADIHQGFLFCLLSSKRPFHELLAPRFIDQPSELFAQFQGMTDVPFTYSLFEEVRSEILIKIHQSFSKDDKEFLLSFASGNPVWDNHTWAGFPGIQWKLLNINSLKLINPNKFYKQLQNLETLFIS